MESERWSTESAIERFLSLFQSFNVASPVPGVTRFALHPWLPYSAPSVHQMRYLRCIKKVARGQWERSDHDTPGSLEPKPRSTESAIERFLSLFESFNVASPRTRGYALRASPLATILCTFGASNAAPSVPQESAPLVRQICTTPRFRRVAPSDVELVD
jgi:hypothetical protein